MMFPCVFQNGWCPVYIRVQPLESLMYVTSRLRVP